MEGVGLQRHAVHDSTDWMSSAACAPDNLGWDWEAVDEAFFPEKHRRAGGVGWYGLAIARRVCARCPVRRPCLRAAVELAEERYPTLLLDTHGRPTIRFVRPNVVGVWGGCSEDERLAVAGLPEDERLDALEEVFAREVMAVMAADEIVA